MATVYYDIKKSEFYTEPRPLYPYDFTDVGQIVRARLQTFITNVEPFHISPIGDVISFELTDANRYVTKISAAPFEVDQDEDDESVYRIKFGYVAMIPSNVLNGMRMFRTWCYHLGQKDKVQKVFQESDGVLVAAARADSYQVLDITYKRDYNTYAAVFEVKVKQLG